MGGAPDSHNLNAVPYRNSVEVLASAARTASGETAANVGWYWAKHFTFVLDVTALDTDVTDTLNVYIQRKLANGDWDDVVAFTQQTGTGSAATLVADVYADPVASDERAVTDGTLSAGTVRKVLIGDAFRIKWVVVSEALTAATGTLELTQNAANTNTVTIGETVYTFKTALSTGPTVPFEVLIGDLATDSIDNLIAAINGDAGEGTLYSTGTTAHPDVTAAVGDGDTLDATASVAGEAGNAIATTDTLAGASAWSGVTLTGGENADQTFTFAVYAYARG